MNAPHEEAVEFAKQSKRENRVYVGNLSYDVKYRDLMEFMRGGGLGVFGLCSGPGSSSSGAGPDSGQGMGSDGASWSLEMESVPAPSAVAAIVSACTFAFFRWGLEEAMDRWETWLWRGAKFGVIAGSGTGTAEKWVEVRDEDEAKTKVTERSGGGVHPARRELEARLSSLWEWMRSQATRLERRGCSGDWDEAPTPTPRRRFHRSFSTWSGVERTVIDGSFLFGFG